GDLLRDEHLDLVRGLGVGLVERRVARRAHDLPLEVGQRRPWMRAGRRRPCEDECRHDHRREPQHHAAAFARALRNSPAKPGSVIGPARCATTFPLRLRTYVSGTWLTP